MKLKAKAQGEDQDQDEKIRLGNMTHSSRKEFENSELQIAVPHSVKNLSFLNYVFCSF
jgi:hypothetical protein